MLRTSFLVAAILASFSEGAAVDVKSVINTAKKLRTESENKLTSVFGSLSGGGGGGISGECALDDSTKIATEIATAYCPATHAVISGAMCDAVKATTTLATFQAAADAAAADGGMVDSAKVDDGTSDCTVATGCTLAELKTYWAKKLTTANGLIDPPVTAAAGAGILAHLQSLLTITTNCYQDASTVPDAVMPAITDTTTEAVKKHQICQCKKKDTKFQAHFCTDASAMKTAGCHNADTGVTAFAAYDVDGDAVDYVEDLTDIGSYWGVGAIITNACTSGDSPKWSSDQASTLKPIVKQYVKLHADAIKHGLGTLGVGLGAVAGADNKPRCFYNAPEPST